MKIVTPPFSAANRTRLPEDATTRGPRHALPRAAATLAKLFPTTAAALPTPPPDQIPVHPGLPTRETQARRASHPGETLSRHATGPPGAQGPRAPRAPSRRGPDNLFSERLAPAWIPEHQQIHRAADVPTEGFEIYVLRSIIEVHEVGFDVVAVEEGVLEEAEGGFAETGREGRGLRDDAGETAAAGGRDAVRIDREGGDELFETRDITRVALGDVD